MDEPISMSTLNDFIFCPVSIYFRGLYGIQEKVLFQTSDQINGTGAHLSVDDASVSNRRRLVGFEVYSEKYNLIGKIDCFEVERGVLIERKKHIDQIYDGYRFQVYGQYFALCEMGYMVKKIMIHSKDDNKNYPIPLPKEDPEMLRKFEAVIQDIKSFDMDSFIQDNPKKCARCIYAPYCDREVTSVDEN